MGGLGSRLLWVQGNAAYVLSVFIVIFKKISLVVATQWGLCVSESESGLPSGELVEFRLVLGTYF